MKTSHLKLEHLLLTSLLIISLSTFGYSQRDDNLLFNGSFTGEPDRSEIAQGWDGYSTPDINDASGVLFTSSSAYEWIGDILPSPNGGTWQNIYGPESVYQNVNLEIGKNYILCIEYAAQGIQALPDLIFDQPVGVQFIINNINVHTSPPDETQYTWETDCITFTATQAVNKIEFMPTAKQYLGIDGACLIEDTMSPTLAIEQRNNHFIFPNPVNKNNQFSIHTPGTEMFDLFIYNNFGLMILHQADIVTSNFIIPEKISIPGTYYYVLRNKKGEDLSGSFLVH